MVFALMLLIPMALSVVVAAETLRVDSGVLVVGDSAARVIQLMGEPVFKEPVENDLGATQGERWQYAMGSRTATITLPGGRVARIEDEAR